MKKIICIMLAAMLLILCSCTGANKDKTVVSPAMKEYLLNINEFEVPVREYGEERSTMLYGEKLVVGVFYPEIGIPEMDSAIESWVNKIVSEYQTESAGYEESEEKTASELAVSYESFITDGKYVSVKMSGFYDSPNLAHPVEIIETFNGNTETEGLMSIEELLLDSGTEKLQQLICERAGVEKELVDENLLAKWLITKDGLQIILSRGEYLPMSDGTKTVKLTYEELKGIIRSAEGEKEQNEAQNTKPEEDKNEPQNQSDNKNTIDKTKPMLALTFDDGPSAYTERLLDVFKKYGGKGTFFVVGNIIDNRPEAVKRIVNEGHEIAGHSWNHRQLTNLSEQEIKDQMMSTRAKIYELTGYDAKLVRPPYGAHNELVRSVAKELEISLVNWSVDTLDWKYRDAEAVYKSVMDSACDGAIILCHDLHKTTVDSMEKVIPALIEKGYQLVTVSELLEAKGKTVSAGEMYYNG